MVHSRLSSSKVNEVLASSVIRGRDFDSLVQNLEGCRKGSSFVRRIYLMRAKIHYLSARIGN